MTLLYNPNTRCNSSFPFHQKTADMRDIDEETAATIVENTLAVNRIVKLYARQASVLREISHYLSSTYSNAYRAVHKKQSHVKLMTMISS